MIRPWLSPAIFVAVLGVSGVGAQSLRFTTVPNPVTGTLSPDADGAAVQTMTVRCRRWATSYFVTFSAGQSGSFAARTAKSGTKSLTYQIYDNATNRNVLKDLSASPTLANVLSGSFVYSTAWTTQDRSFTLSIPAGQLPAAGTYTDSITVQLYPGTPASHGARQASSSFTVSITVTSLLDISLVATGAPFDVARRTGTFDFGSLVPGASRSADVMARSNTAYTIAVVSLNSGLLRPADLSDASSVPYRLQANGVTLNLSTGTPQPVVTAAPATTFAGRRAAISVDIGDYGWATEGAYSDVLTFQATAN